MNKVGYNGWTNYETWCVHLWLSNDEGSYDYWREQARESFTRASTHRTGKVPSKSVWTVSEQARYDLADTLKDEMENGSQDLLARGHAEASLWADLLGAALSEVNWAEIANAFLEGYESSDGEKYEYADC